MKNSNDGSTRYYSAAHEDSVVKALGGQRVANSGAIKFGAGDVIQRNASLLIECKTTMTEKKSVSIKREWIEKNKQEAFQTRYDNHVVCFNFGPDTSNYYVIDEKLMKFLVEKLVEEYS